MKNLTATTITELEDIFAAVVDKIAYGSKDLTLIEVYEGPRPRVPHAAVHLVNLKAQEHEIKEYAMNQDGRYRETLKGTAWVRANIHFFGKNAFETATQVQGAFLAQARLFDLLPKIGLGDISDVQDTSQPNQGKVESRAAFTVSFYANLTTEHDAEYITHVKGSISVDGGKVPIDIEVDS